MLGNMNESIKQIGFGMIPGFRICSGNRSIASRTFALTLIRVSSDIKEFFEVIRIFFNLPPPNNMVSISDHNNHAGNLFNKKMEGKKITFMGIAEYLKFQCPEASHTASQEADSASDAEHHFPFAQKICSSLKYFLRPL